MGDTPDTQPNGDDEVSGTRWVELLGDGAKPSILLAMLAQRHHDLNKSDIAKAAGVSRMTVHRNLDDLVDLGAVEQTRTAGNSKMYQFDADSEVGVALVNLEHSLCRTVAERVDREAGVDGTYRNCIE